MITGPSAFHGPLFLLVGCGKSATATPCLGSPRGQSQKFREVLGRLQETGEEFNAVECLDVLFKILLKPS